MDSSPAVETRIREMAETLATAYQRIIRVEVVVEAPHRRGVKGQRYHLRIKIEVPGNDVMISRDPGDDNAHEDIYVAIRDAFHAARRRLEVHVAKELRRDVKDHSGPTHGRVVFLDVERLWGHLEAADGRRIYFHRNAVVGDVDELEIGDEVRFEEEAGIEGPQATTVSPIGVHGRHELPAT